MKIKGKLTTTPVLAYLNFDKFFLETDVSGSSLGAVLEQEQEDRQLHPVAYSSRSLTKSKECLK